MNLIDFTVKKKKQKKKKKLTNIKVVGHFKFTVCILLMFLSVFYVAVIGVYTPLRSAGCFGGSKGLTLLLSPCPIPNV